MWEKPYFLLPFPKESTLFRISDVTCKTSVFVYFLKPSGKSIVAFLFHNFSLLLIILYTCLQKVSLVHLTKLSIILLLPQANLQRAKSILVTCSWDPSSPRASITSFSSYFRSTLWLLCVNLYTTYEKSEERRITTFFSWQLS